MDGVRSKPGQTTLVKSLSWREPARELPALRPDEWNDSATEATHLLIRNSAFPIGDAGLELQIAETGQLQVATGSADERVDLAIRRSEMGLFLECAEDVNALVNESPANASTRLFSGDRIGAADSAERAQLIEVRNDRA